MRQRVASSDYSATRFASLKGQFRFHHERRTMVQTDAELAADERADQLCSTMIGASCGPWGNSSTWRGTETCLDLECPPSAPAADREHSSLGSVPS